MKKQLIILLTTLLIFAVSLVIFSVKLPDLVFPILPFLIMIIGLIAIVSGIIIVNINSKLNSTEKIVLSGIILVFNMLGIIVCLLFAIINKKNDLQQE